MADFRLNAGLTHSQTLMKLIDSSMDALGMKPDELDFIAVSCGPGSFTGVRIGAATAKGIAFARNIPCVAVSTLEAAAAALSGLTGSCCVVMDARRDQFYTATFLLDKGYTRTTPDEALSAAELAQRLGRIKDTVWICGDGAEKFFDAYSASLSNIRLAPLAMRKQNGLGAGLAAMRMIADGITVDADELVPIYLRLPQAERELRKKQQEGSI